MHAGIAGAGIMGQLLALSLINAGWKVSIFDRSELHNCSQAALGILTPFCELGKGSVEISKLGQEALNIHWPKILDQLKSDIYFRRMGTIILSPSGEEADLNKFIQVITDKLQHKNFYKKLNQQELIKLEPQLSNFAQGYYFPDEGQLDNQMLLNSLKEYLSLKGVSWYKNIFVESVQPYQVITQEKTFEFDLVFDCRGLGGKEWFGDLRGIRGEAIWLHAPKVSIHHLIRFMDPHYPVYITPRPNHVYILGASEIDSEDFSPISVKTLLDYLTRAKAIHPGFSDARVIKTVTQCRPTLNNRLPKINYSEGLISVNGLYRYGFTIAPTLTSHIMKEIQ